LLRKLATAATSPTISYLSSLATKALQAAADASTAAVKSTDEFSPWSNAANCGIFPANFDLTVATAGYLYE
jgi:hypothetical protein